MFTNAGVVSYDGIVFIHPKAIVLYIVRGVTFSNNLTKVTASQNRLCVSIATRKYLTDFGYYLEYNLPIYCCKTC